MPVYAIIYDIQYRNPELNENSLWGSNVGLTFYPARTEEEAREWFETKGVEDVRRFRQIGVEGAVIREMHEVQVQGFAIFAISNEALRLEERTLAEYFSR